MKTFVSIVTATVLTLGFSTSSQAENEVAFSYNPNATVASVYADLNNQAVDVCENEMGAFRQYGVRKCAIDYVEQVVEQIDRVELTAFHQRMISGGSDIIELAQLEE